MSAPSAGRRRRRRPRSWRFPASSARSLACAFANGARCRQLDRLIAARKPELIHAQFGLGGALALPIAVKTGLPLVVTFHGGDATKDKHFARRARRPRSSSGAEAMTDRAAAILCVSHFVRDTLIGRGFPAEKLALHYLGSIFPWMRCCRRQASAYSAVRRPPGGEEGCRHADRCHGGPAERGWSYR